MKQQFLIHQKKIIQRLHSAEGVVADVITRFAGSMRFVYLHILWFTLWISINSGYLSTLIPIFDPYPYGMLTTVVSLEAIFLSTFIMVAHNRQTLMDEYREIEEDIEEEEVERLVQDIEQDLDDLKLAITNIEKKILNPDTSQVRNK